MTSKAAATQDKNGSLTILWLSSRARRAWNSRARILNKLEVWSLTNNNGSTTFLPRCSTHCTHKFTYRSSSIASWLHWSSTFSRMRLSMSMRMSSYFIVCYTSAIESGIMTTAWLKILEGRMSSGKTISSGSGLLSM